jgi:uncharacterized repeat protein (TIGR01451 family)
MFAARSSTYDSSARGPDPGGRRSRGSRGILVALLAGLAAFAMPTASAFGEGSVDFNTGPGDGNRQGLSVANASGAGTNRSPLSVYAQPGETIQMASSQMGLGGANIRVFAPGADPTTATPLFDCVASQPGSGRIDSRSEELAGPLPNAGGYDACDFVVPAGGGGSYTVIMYGVSSDNGGPGTVDVPNTGAGQGYNASMWDVTIRDAGGAVQPGRLFAPQLQLRTVAERDIGSGAQAYVYTKTGYEYQVNFYQHAGANWIMTADDKGVIDSITGERIFASFACGNDLPTNNECQYSNARTATDFATTPTVATGTYPIFLNRVDPLVISGPGGLAQTTGYTATPISPASNPLANPAFTGSAGQTGATNQGSGGTISFTSPTAMERLGYTVLIDTNRDGTFGNGSDFVDDNSELAASGANAFAWNGRDGAGAVPACGDYQYQVRSSLSEVHFTMVDVEESGGTRIERLTLPTDPILGPPLAANYNNVDPYKPGTYVVTDGIPAVATDEISGPGFNAWDNISGNTDYIDTWTQLPEVQTSGTLRLLCSDPQVIKTATPSPAVPGEDLTFRLEVKNNGPDAATNVVATDDLPDTVTFKSASQGCAEAGSVVTCTVASLAAGATQTFEIVVAVPSDIAECIDNTATLTSTGPPDTNTANNTSTICVPTKGKSNVSITKVASATTVPTGGQVMYTLVVKNNGPSDDPGVKVTDALPAGLTLAAAKPSQGTCTTANNTAACELGALKKGGSAQVLVTVNVTATSGCIPNTARVQGAHEDPDPADNEASAQVCVELPPTPPAVFDLEVDKRASVTRPVVGQRVTYTVVVTNNGPDAAPAAKLTDTYNNRATVVSVSTTAGSCTKAMPITCELGRIESGASVTVTVVIKPRVSGRARNAASATSCCGTDKVPDNNMDTVDIRVRKVALKVTKVASSASVQAGSTLNYRIRVRNPSKGEARNVKVCDRLPSGLRFVSSSPKAKRSGGQRCWTIKSLKAGKSRTYRVTVRTAKGANGRKVNRASISSPSIKPAIARRPVQVRGAQPGVTG